MTTLKGPGIFLAQFMGDQPPFSDLKSICLWAKSIGFKGVQIPTWDARCIDLQKAAESKTYADELKGTVNVPNLGYYKYEFSRPGEELWLPIAVGNQAKNDGQIGFWNTSLLDQGDYFLRLVVSDNEDNLFPACKIPVRVVNP